MKLSIDEINQIIACPKCQTPLVLAESKDAQCEKCGESYSWLLGTWKLIPSSWSQSSNLWPVWEQLQANGVVSYTEDPEHNLNVGKRQVSIDFSNFCQFDGLVLDVGCGPQPWPSHFGSSSAATRFVGVDPLAEGAEAYSQFCALGEFLPFREGVFDHVVFATSLDHFLDPVPALKEAVRVCRVEGELDLWVGEKSPSTPKPSTSPEWYSNLIKPEGAEDVFHFKRLTAVETEGLFERVGLRIVDKEVQKVDEYRSNYFYRLRPANGS